MKIHDAFTVCATGPSQFAAIAALQGPRECVKFFRDTYTKRRKLFCDYLDQLKDLFEY